uniref:Choline transporter-like protein n=1 Tax=Electrophorus electricus TaxID=8005 RepID=A0A4W4GSJ5_ELEEL
MPENEDHYGKHGEPRKYDPSFKGPIQNRSCTDIICCILFILAILSYIVLGILAWSQGDPRKVIYPTDSSGQFCGQVGTPLQNKKFLFYFNILKCASPMVLLAFQCPTTQVCGPSNPHPGSTIAPSYCLFFHSALVIATILSLVFIVLLRFLAGIMVWVMIAMVLIVITYGIIHCSFMYVNLKETPGANVTLKELGFQMDLSMYLHIRQTWLAFAIILAIVELIVILLLIFLRKRICIAIALIKEASRAIGHVMFSLIYPLLTFFLLAIIIAYWAITAVFLSTSNEPVYRVFNQANEKCIYANQTCNPEECPKTECLFTFYGGETAYHKYLIVLQFYNLFLFFWCANFVTALGQMTLAGAFASYYWAFDKAQDMPACPVFASLGRALRYHTGSLAFGSLILSIIQVIRVLLEYLDHKLKGAQNKFAKFLLCCLKCCFWCLEKLIKFLNRNAYIMVAIYGKNFCVSARDAFFLLMRNVIRVAVLDKVTDFLLFLGKISASVHIVTFIIEHTHMWVCACMWLFVFSQTIVIGTYFIAHGFFSVYAMCVDTLFLCFLEDLEWNDGSEERRYLMSDSLLKVLGKKNQGK